MRLKLDRPIVVTDFETTGLDVNKDRIVQIGMKKIIPNNFPLAYATLVNPTIPIPREATGTHGITDEMVKDKPTFAEIADAVVDFIGGCDIGGYNILSFDMPLLYNEFLRVGITWDYHDVRFIDACNIAKRKESRSLEWATELYCNHKHEEAHDAAHDANAAADVLIAQVEKYTDLEPDVESLARYSNHDSPVLDFSGKFRMKYGKIVLTFGNHRDEPASEHLDFLKWMLSKDFNPDTKTVAKKILSREFK